MSPAAMKFGVVLLVSMALAGCGVKGSLDNPPETQKETTASADSGQGKSEGAAPKPHKEFILDGLLR